MEQVVELIQSGRTEELQRLLDADPALARAVIVDARRVQRTLLHVATDWPGHFPNAARTIEILIAAGADPNAQVIQSGPAKSAETPLHWAASSNDVAALDALLAGGADIEAPGAVFTNGTPMSDAVIFAQWDAARRLLARGARTTLTQAAALGLLDRVRAYWAEDAPPPGPEDVTKALWHACRGGDLATVQFLVARGGDLHWIGWDHLRPVDAAQKSGSAELLTWLGSL